MADMDITQVAQTITWLDEEHRRDRAELARSRQRLEIQETELQDMARRIQELEGRLASSQAQFIRFNQIEQSLDHLKNEMAIMLQKIDESRLQSERETERTRLSDREAVARAISEIRRELSRFTHIEEDLDLRRAEDQRLAEVVLNLRDQQTLLSKDLDERTRGLPYIGEQRQQDNKRIAQLQQETVELFKRVEHVGGRLPGLEEGIQRTERSTANIQPFATELKRTQEQFIEGQRLAEVERERRVNEWADDFEAMRLEIERHSKHVQGFAEQTESSKQALAALAKFEEQIRRDQNQLAELQRLSEERQHKELLDWQAENEKLWKKFQLEFEHSEQAQERTNQELASRFPPLEKTVAFQEQQNGYVWRVYEAYGAHQLAEAQRWLQMLGELMEGRPKSDGWSTSVPKNPQTGTE